MIQNPELKISEDILDTFAENLSTLVAYNLDFYLVPFFTSMVPGIPVLIPDGAKLDQLSSWVQDLPDCELVIITVLPSIAKCVIAVPQGEYLFFSFFGMTDDRMVCRY